MSYTYDNTSHPNCQAHEWCAELSARKQRADLIGEHLYQGGYHKPAAALWDCGDTLIVREYLNGYHEIIGAMFCRQRLCPMCSWRRGLKLYSDLCKVMDRIDKARTDDGYAPYRYISLTLTVQNPRDLPELAEVLTKMRKGFLQLTKRPEWVRAIKGAYSVLEITRNQDPKSKNYLTWHPHYHVLLAVVPSYFNDRKSYIKHDTWVDLWRLSAKLGYKPSVKVQAIPEAHATHLDERTGELRDLPELQTPRGHALVHEQSNAAPVDADEGNRLKRGVALDNWARYLCVPDWFSGAINAALDDEQRRQEATDIVCGMYSLLKGRKLCRWYGIMREAHRDLHLSDEDGDLLDVGEMRPDLAYYIKQLRYDRDGGAYHEIDIRDMHHPQAALTHRQAWAAEELPMRDLPELDDEPFTEHTDDD